MRSVPFKNGLLLTLCVGVTWLLLMFVGHFLLGLRCLEGISLAALICWLPGLIVCRLHGRLGKKSCQDASERPSGSGEVSFFLLGMGLRVVVVSLGAMQVLSSRPQLPRMEFLVWLLVFYLITLFVETRLLLQELSCGRGSKTLNSSP